MEIQAKLICLNAVDLRAEVQGLLSPGAQRGGSLRLPGAAAAGRARRHRGRGGQRGAGVGARRPLRSAGELGPRADVGGAVQSGGAHRRLRTRALREGRRFRGETGRKAARSEPQPRHFNILYSIYSNILGYCLIPCVVSNSMPRWRNARTSRHVLLEKSGPQVSRP